MLLALEGSVGYGMGGARVEIEVGYERFPIQGVSGGKGDDGDAVFLLAKELANDVVRNKTTELTNAIGKVTRKGLYDFAKAIEIDAKEGVKKICDKMAGSQGTVNSDAEGTKEDALLRGGDDWCACWGVNVKAQSSGGATSVACQTTGTAATAEAAGVGRPGGKRWSEMVGSGLKNENKSVDEKTSKVISSGIEKLDKDEKSKVAGAFAKTIEGAEVVEVKAVTSTSVIVNACYDLINDSIGVIPYACVGLGGNFVGEAI